MTRARGDVGKFDCKIVYSARLESLRGVDPEAGFPSRKQRVELITRSDDAWLARNAVITGVGCSSQNGDLAEVTQSLSKHPLPGF